MSDAFENHLFLLVLLLVVLVLSYMIFLPEQKRKPENVWDPPKTTIVCEVCQSALSTSEASQQEIFESRLSWKCLGCGLLRSFANAVKPPETYGAHGTIEVNKQLIRDSGDRDLLVWKYKHGFYEYHGEIYRRENTNFGGKLLKTKMASSTHSFEVSALQWSWRRIRISSHLPYRMSPKFDSIRLIPLIREWMGACESHRCLKKQTLKFHLPTRVIDLTDFEDGHVFLKSSRGLLEKRYICLSYCWGGEVPLKLTKKNKMEMESKIALAALPKLFLDFIQIAIALGIRYVWIDSLCIIQDDAEDWKKEAASMNLVYGNSYLTIAASATSNPKYSLFGYPCQSLDQQIELCSGVFMRKRRHPIGIQDTLDQNGQISNWSKRGWTFEEYLLSARVLHFTDTELVWHCNESMRCECRNTVSFTGEMLLEGLPRQQFQAALEPYALQKRKIEAWHTCVEEYSKRILTKRTDNAFAISGIAEAFMKSMNCRYYVGIWESSIVEDLYWWRIPGSRRTNDSWTTSNTDYLAPSWSWLAIGGPVEFAKLSPIYSKHINESSGVVAGHMNILAWCTNQIALSVDSKGFLYLHPTTLDKYADVMEQQYMGKPCGALDRNPTVSEEKFGISAYCLLGLTRDHMDERGMRNAVMIVVEKVETTRPLHTSSSSSTMSSLSPALSGKREFSEKFKGRMEPQSQPQRSELSAQLCRRIGILSTIQVNRDEMQRKHMFHLNWNIV